MKISRKIVAMAVTLMMCSVALVAAEKRASPPTQASAVIAGKKITIDYGAPSRRARKIMGGLVPFGKVWRTGANEATTLKTEGDLTFGKVLVPKGTYTIYTIPGQKEWTLILNKQNGQWGTEYDQKQDLGRVVMSVSPMKAAMETFVIAIEPGKGKSGVLRMKWENTEAAVSFSVR